MLHLSKKSILLIAYTLVISGSFYLGTMIFSVFFLPQEEITAVSIKEFAPALESIRTKGIILGADNSKIIVKNTQLNKWIESYVRAYTSKSDLRISYPLLANYLESIAPSLNVEPVNAKLKFQDNRADVFVPPVPGRKLNIDNSATTIAEAILDNKASASLVFDTIEPEITLEKINSLGIKTLLAKGQSDYGKSTAARIHNIKVGLSKFNGIILKPGEEFSFNKFLGDVDDKAGYEAELVIKSGQLVKEFGGGLCQVATTVFRAAILSGFDITERKPHSFPVHYYDPQGFDATIYPGVVDLKFINNTENHVLIQAKLVGSKLSVEMYGSDDGRKITMNTPVSYDKKPSGAMKAYFIRRISKDGVEKEERFDSTYKAPPASPLERNPLE